MNDIIREMVDKEKLLMAQEESKSTPFAKSEHRVATFSADDIVKQAERSAVDELGKSKIKDRASKKWTKVKKRRIDNVIEQEDVVSELEKATNKADRQEIANRLYVLKQEKKRSQKEQQHLNRTQREKQRQEIADFRWEEYEETLAKYGYNKTPSNVVFRTIIFIDGIVCFLEGLNKASNKLVKVMKWVIIAGLAVACYYIIKAL